MDPLRIRGVGRTILPALLVLLMASSARAYEVVEVQHGGTITGNVTLDGPVPLPKGFNLVTFPDPQYCGRISNGSGWRLLHDFTVDPAGGFKDVVVMLEGVEAGKPFAIEKLTPNRPDQPFDERMRHWGVGDRLVLLDIEYAQVGEPTVEAE